MILVVYLCIILLIGPLLIGPNTTIASAADDEKRDEEAAANHDATAKPKEGCARRHFEGQDSFVCVCNASYCDEFDNDDDDEFGFGFDTDDDYDNDEKDDGPDSPLVYYISDRRQHRMHKMVTKWRRDEEALDLPDIRIDIDASTKFQTILGFGGAFTDAAGLNLNGLSARTREHLLRAYFHPRKGIRYIFGRVPIASTDFSTREYSYVDTEGDLAMNTFALSAEDIEVKIPYIKRAISLVSDGDGDRQQMRLIACPWSAPAWMKDDGRMSGGGELIGTPEDGPYYGAYAKYIKRFFDEYAKHGIRFWALTVQNQPAKVPPEFPFVFQAMFMSNRTQWEFAIRLLRPLLRQSPHSSALKLILFDDTRVAFLPSLSEIFDEEQKSSSGGSGGICGLVHKYLSPILPDFISKHFAKRISRPFAAGDGTPLDVIDGIGVHWYTLDGHAEQSAFHEKHPDKLILATEACTGFAHPHDARPRLGNWTRGWQYGWDIVQNFRHWTNAWIDWNICLDMEGGPNWVNNFVDAPIIVNAERDEFYKQPMFYFLAHFSRFIVPDSVRIRSMLRRREPPVDEADEATRLIQHVAARTPEGRTVLVLINADTRPTMAQIREEGGLGRRSALIELPPESILSAIWR